MRLLLVILLLGLVCTTVLARKNRRRNRNRDEIRELRPLDDPAADDDDDDDDDEDEEEETANNEPKVLKSPCDTKRCNRGEQCDVDENGLAVCLCRYECPMPADLRLMACSNKNVTFRSECHLDREHCLCRKKLPECKHPRHGKIQLDYYGACTDVSPCPGQELTDFPGRARDWLYNVMRELANRNDLGEYLDLLEGAQTDPFHVNAVLWKFCDLDKTPHDRFVTRREMLFIIRSLKAMEHCLMPFLRACDTNNDRRISLVEWGTCLGIEKGKISDICLDIHRKAGRRT